jgi:DNA invertase Pin-like site-specific DNA recombinase
MKKYFAYTRVSTVRQGEHGVSLQEQKSEIERYAHQKGLVISEWFEERETAARLGRTVFTQMMKRLRGGDAAGVVIHKIDRSARNLRDWVDIGQLTDDGIEVHFTREAIDMQSSSGRLSADVQAVVAANYIRNLREETIKGLYGRLKQGFYPMQSPLGYVDQGGGKAKTIDPVRGPLVRDAFRLYASRKYSQSALVTEIAKRGLRTKKGEIVSKNTLAGILSNPFYYGLIHIKKGNKSFAGAHEPLISRKLFDQVQEVLHGRSVRSTPKRRQFLFSRLLRCGCGRSLIGEEQKGHIYYRCHLHSCVGTSVSEEAVASAITTLFAAMTLRPEELEELHRYMEEKRQSATKNDHDRLAAAERRLSGLKDRQGRLTDALLDGHIEGAVYEERKKTLLSECLECEAEIRDIRSNPGGYLQRLEEFVELAKSACLLFKHGNTEQKRDMVRFAMSNRVVRGKTLDFSLVSELSAIAERSSDQNGGTTCGTRRTFWEKWVDGLLSTIETAY